MMVWNLKLSKQSVKWASFDSVSELWKISSFIWMCQILTFEILIQISEVTCISVAIWCDCYIPPSNIWINNPSRLPIIARVFTRRIGEHKYRNVISQLFHSWTERWTADKPGVFRRCSEFSDTCDKFDDDDVGPKDMLLSLGDINIIVDRTSDTCCSVIGSNLCAAAAAGDSDNQPREVPTWPEVYKLY